MATAADIFLSVLDDPRVAARLRDLLKAPSTVAAPPPVPIYLTIVQFAERHGVSSKTVRRWLSAGMPYHRPATRIVRIPTKDADRWLEEGHGRVTA